MRKENKRKLLLPRYLLSSTSLIIYQSLWTEFADGRSRLKSRFSHNPNLSFIRTHTILGGQLRKKPTLAINFRFPWGYMNLYFELPQKLAVFMVHPADNKYKSKSNNAAASSIDADTSLSIAEKTVAKWLLGDDDYKNQRLKLIPYIAEGPWVVRNMVTGRPAIIGKKLPVSYHLLSSNTGANCSSSSSEQPLLTATLDIGNSSATANRIVSVCRRYMSALTVDIGFVIQSESPQELPEQMLGAIRVHGPDPSKAPKLY